MMMTLFVFSVVAIALAEAVKVNNEINLGK